MKALGKAGRLVGDCSICAADLAFLRSERPPYEALRPCVRVVDLFAGCGALSLGVAEAACRLGLGTDIRLAVDVDETATTTFKANFPGANVETKRVEQLFDGDLGKALTKFEKRIRDFVGTVDVLVGGPPCQGHSDLNNHTRRADPRNALYTRMARAADVLKPTLVLIENVPTVMHDVEGVLDAAVNRLTECGYAVAHAVIDISKLGAPQRRRRHVVLASRDRRVDVKAIVSQVSPRCPHHPGRSVEWAIADLVHIQANGIFDTPSTTSRENLKRMAWLFDSKEHDLPNRLRPKCHRSDHSYRSMYGRLDWKEPAQTVTTGFGSMGQGRYVHPAKRRTITPHEAARLQMLPDFWDLSMVTKRRDLARLIGNAVPPVLASSLLTPALSSLHLAPSTPFPERELHRFRTNTQRIRRRRTNQTARRRGVPRPTSLAARNRMIAVKKSGTAAELALRAELDRLGLAYQVDEPVAGTRCRTDMLFYESGLVVLVDGCFWHSCPIHGTFSKSNATWWKEKLAANRRRDHEANQKLREMGWIVLRFWEHDDPSRAAQGVAALIRTRKEMAASRTL